MGLLEAYRAYKEDREKPNWDLGYADGNTITKYWDN